MHVDDGWYVTCSCTLRNELKSILTGRYGPIAFNDASTGVCGVRLTPHADHSCTLDQGANILKFLHQFGMDLLPPALTPSTANFFDPPSDLTLVDCTRFLRINGTLLFLLAIRHGIKKEVVHLCARKSSPTNLTFQSKYTSYDTSKAALTLVLLSLPAHLLPHPVSLSLPPLTHPTHAIPTDTHTPRIPSKSVPPTLHSWSTLPLKRPA